MFRVYNCKTCINKEQDCMATCSNYELKPSYYKLKVGKKTNKLETQKIKEGNLNGK